MCTQSCNVLQSAIYNETTSTHKNVCVTQCESGYYEVSETQAQQRNCISSCGDEKVKLQVQNTEMFECRARCSLQMPYLSTVTLKNSQTITCVCKAACPFKMYVVEDG